MVTIILCSASFKAHAMSFEHADLLATAGTGGVEFVGKGIHAMVGAREKASKVKSATAPEPKVKHELEQVGGLQISSEFVEEGEGGAGVRWFKD